MSINVEDLWKEAAAARGDGAILPSTPTTIAQPSVEPTAATHAHRAPFRFVRRTSQQSLVGAIPSTSYVQAEALRSGAIEQSNARAEEEKEYRRRSIEQGVMHDGICEQVHNLFCLNGRPLIDPNDFTYGVCDSREKCEEGMCSGEPLELKLYAVQPDDEQDDLLDHLRRQKTAPSMYISDRALECGVKCGMLADPRFMRSAAEMARRREVQKFSQKAKIDHSPFNLLIHACVEKYCTLHISAPKAQRDLYAKIHESRIDGANVIKTIYFCKRHMRFHICDQLCDQTRAIKRGGTLCVLSAAVKTGIGSLFLFGDGTGTDEQRETMADINVMRDTHEANDPELEGMAINPQQQIDVKQRRKSHFTGVTIVRDRSNRGSGEAGAVASNVDAGSARGGRGRRRGRGRGRGAIAGGGNRQQTARRQMALSLTKSSGDADSTLTPQDEATKYAQIASYSNGYSSSVASRDTIAGKMGMESEATPSIAVGVSGVAGSGSTNSRKRKLLRSKRTNAAQMTKPIVLSMKVPRYLLEVDVINLTEDDRPAAQKAKRVKLEPKPEQKPGVAASVRAEDHDDGPLVDEVEETQAAEQRAAMMRAPLPVSGVKSEDDQFLNSRLAAPTSCAYQVQSQDDDSEDEDTRPSLETDLISISINLQPGAPFAERQENRHDELFVIDSMQITKQQPERMARFRLSPQQRSDYGNTFFSTDELFSKYAVSACEIIWRLFFGKERGSIERAKLVTCQARTQSEIASYVTKQTKENHYLMAERAARICMQEFDRASIFKTLVIDLEFLKILETYWALLVVEFYINLMSLPQKLAVHLDDTTNDTIKKQFHFEHLVPAIVNFLREGLEVKGSMILPKDCTFIQEWFPETSTMKSMGIPEQTMTHLQIAIRTYIAAADRSNVSMRRFECTHLSWQDLAILRVPGHIVGTEKMDAVERSNFLAHHVVGMFIKRRARRLNSFKRFVGTE